MALSTFFVATKEIFQEIKVARFILPRAQKTFHLFADFEKSRSVIAGFVSESSPDCASRPRLRHSFMNDPLSESYIFKHFSRHSYF